MSQPNTVFIINGSASRNSVNAQIIDAFCALTKDKLRFSFAGDLKTLPHFDPEQSVANVPAAVSSLRDAIQRADGILICTPEYVFSIPAGLKNAIEWCVATTVFSDKPVGLITASASGKKAHEELQLIMRTLMTRFDAATTLLIPGIRGKLNEHGAIADPRTLQALERFAAAFIDAVNIGCA